MRLFRFSRSLLSLLRIYLALRGRAGGGGDASRGAQSAPDQSTAHASSATSPASIASAGLEVLWFDDADAGALLPAAMPAGQRLVLTIGRLAAASPWRTRARDDAAAFYEVDSAEAIQPRWLAGVRVAAVVIARDCPEACVRAARQRLARFSHAAQRGLLEGWAR